jgi:Flp pilus assembly protein TadD
MTFEQQLESGLSHHRAGKLVEAERIYRQLLAQQPKHPEALHMLGLLAGQLGRNDLAVDLLREAIGLNPGNAEAHNNLWVILRRTGRLDEAIIGCRRSIALNPSLSETHNNLGLAMRDKGQFDEATAAFGRAIALRPNNAEAYCNLGVTLRKGGRLDEAITVLGHAIAINPNLPEAHNQLGNVYFETGQINEAMAVYRRAIALNPDHAEAHTNLALTLLARGDFQEGWQEYEWRGRCKDFLSPARNYPQAQWDGRPLQDRILLLQVEQGLGDVIQFLRYVPLVRRRGVRVILECQAELRRLLEIAGCDCQLALRGEPVPDFDVHCPLLTLPRIFGANLSNIPNTVPYLRADARDSERWRRRLAGEGQFAKVGLRWAANPAHGSPHRSMKLATLAPLGGVIGVKFFSLQKGAAADEAQTPPPGLQLIDWTEELTDFADTAALVANLDLVISVDTSVGHLAGAMGKQVWSMLPFVADWRWLLGRDDSPWYPTMRLFRQSRRGDWGEVIAQVAEALSRWTKR